MWTRYNTKIVLATLSNFIVKLNSWASEIREVVRRTLLEPRFSPLEHRFDRFTIRGACRLFAKVLDDFGDFPPYIYDRPLLLSVRLKSFPSGLGLNDPSAKADNVTSGFCVQQFEQNLGFGFTERVPSTVLHELTHTNLVVFFEDLVGVDERPVKGSG